MALQINGTTLDKLYINGSTMDTGYINGTEVFSGFKPTIGDFIEGGYYVGKIVISGSAYGIIVSPKASRLTGDVNSGNMVAPSFNDGLSNTNALAADGVSLAITVKGMTINGKSDWYIPSINELELCYRNFKPHTSDNITGDSLLYPGNPNGYNPDSSPLGSGYSSTSPSQTPFTIFRSNGSEAFDNSGEYYSYGSSTQRQYLPVMNNYFQIMRADYNPGLQSYSSQAAYFRPVRRVPM